MIWLIQTGKFGNVHIQDLLDLAQYRCTKVPINETKPEDVFRELNLNHRLLRESGVTPMTAGDFYIYFDKENQEYVIIACRTVGWEEIGRMGVL